MPGLPPGERLVALLLDWLAPLIWARQAPRPAPVRVRVTSRRTPMGLVFDVVAVLPPLPTLDPAAPAIVSQEVVFSVDGVAQPPLSPPLTATDLPAVTVNDGQTVSATHTYTNALGHTSVPESDSFVVSAASFPPEAGHFAFKVTEREV